MKRFKPEFILLSSVFIAYLNSFWGSFQFDDYNVIVNNPVVHSWALWVSDLPHGIRPLLKFTYTLNWTSGLGLFGFHLFNIITHAVNAILVYLLTCSLIRRCPLYASEESLKMMALLTALLFALHPVQTESIIYISGRSTSLMSTFYLGSLLAYAHGSQSERGTWLRVISLFLFMAAFMVKEVAITLPAALVLWEICVNKDYREKGFRDVAKKQIFHWGLLMVIIFFILTHSGYTGLLLFSFNIRSISANLLSEINGIFYLITRVFFVNSLNIDPDIPTAYTWDHTLTMKFVFLFILVLFAVWSVRRRPWITFGILWFFLNLSSTNSIVPRLDIVNERQLYIPLWGVFLVAVIEFVRLKSILRLRAGFLRTCACVVLIILGFFTFERNMAYRSEVTLWEDTVRKSPNKARAYNNLGYAYFLESRYEDAKKAYEMALCIKPDFVIASNNLESVHKKMTQKKDIRSITIPVY